MLSNHPSEITGIHIRLKYSFSELLQQVYKFSISVVQFFVISTYKKHHLDISQEDIEEFKRVKEKLFSHVFIHSSYLVNLASGNIKVLNFSKKIIKKEIELAKKLGIKHIVLHPGCATGHATNDVNVSKERGMLQLATILNTLLCDNPDIIFLLENTAHAGRTIGSNLSDFCFLRHHIDSNSKVKFCLDLAHAFVYGYDVRQVETFLRLVDQTMSLDNVQLIHINDAAEKLGSQKDRHELPGCGNIGKDVLMNFLHSPVFQYVPKILEPPQLEHVDITNAFSEMLLT